MAKHTNEKFVDKKVNLACLLLALIFTVFAVFAYSTTLGSLSFGSVSMDMTADETETLIKDITEDGKIYRVADLIIFVIVAIIQFVALINVIRLILGWFGFIGKKDSHRMARKLSKHAKITFAIAGSAITIQIFAAADDGVFAPSSSGLFAFTGIIVLLTYLLVRFYRNFVVEKTPLTTWLFPLIRDALLFVFPVFIFAFIELSFVGDLSSGLAALSGESNLTGRALSAAMQTFINGFMGLFVVLSFTGIVKRTIKFLPFDNYKRPAPKKISAKYRWAVVAPLVFVIIGGITLTVVENQAFVVDDFTSYVTENITLAVKLIIAAIGVTILGCVAVKSEDPEIKLASKAPELVEADNNFTDTYKEPIVTMTAEPVSTPAENNVNEVPVFAEASVETSEVSVAEETPVVEDAPVTLEAPTVEETSAVIEQTPTEAPVAEEAVSEAEEAPVEPKSQAFEAAPAFLESTPAVEQAPVAEGTPVTEEAPVAQKKAAPKKTSSAAKSTGTKSGTAKKTSSASSKTSASKSGTASKSATAKKSTSSAKSSTAKTGAAKKTSSSSKSSTAKKAAEEKKEDKAE